MTAKELPISGYEKEYLLYSDGRVLSLRKDRFLKPDNRCGYLAVTLALNKNNKKYSVHRLVALHFVDNPLNKPCVNHKDGNKLNNNFDNLEWVTYSENERHSFNYLGKRIKHSTETRLKQSLAAKGRDMSKQVALSVSVRKGKPAHNRKKPLL